MRSYVMYLYCNLHVNANITLSLTILGSVKLRALFVLISRLIYFLFAWTVRGSRRISCTIISVCFYYFARITKRKKVEN